MGPLKGSMWFWILMNENKKVQLHRLQQLFDCVFDCLLVCRFVIYLECTLSMLQYLALEHV